MTSPWWWCPDLAQTVVFCKALHLCFVHLPQLNISVCGAWLQRGDQADITPEHAMEERMVKKKMRELQVRMWTTYFQVVTVVLSISLLGSSLNILRGRPRWTTPALDWSRIGFFVLAAVPMLSPKILSMRHAMDLCAVVIFVFPLVATLRAGSSSDQLLFMMTSVYVTVQIPTACMASNIWWVIIANLGMVVGLLLRAPYIHSFDPGQCLHESTMTLAWLEICFGVSCVIIARGTQAFLKMNERQRIRYKRATTELDAATSLLQLTCDAVVELDEDLCLKDHSKELAGILLRKPDSSLAGRSFMEFVASSPEKVSVRQKLSDSACGAERVNESFANAFHTRLVDSCCSKFRTEVFHVSFRREDGEQCHLVGLRDFTDQESLARAHANRDGDARKRHGRFTSVDVRPQSPRSSDPNEVSRSHTVSMIFDMDSQMVDAASPPVCSLVGLSLPELFPDSGHEVFQTVWSSVAPYLQTEGMEAVAHVLHRFDGLLVRWGPSLNEHIDGTVELIQLQRGRSCDYRLLLKCRGSPVGISSTLPSNPGQSIGVLPGTPLFERGSFLNASCENSGGTRT